MITAGDFLAGGGGVTHAMSKMENVNVRFVLNHDKDAIRTNLFNHRGIKHYFADIYKQDEHEVEKVDFIWASIECTQHSRANGGRDKNIGSYTLGWELVRYIKYIMPYGIGIENVPEFREWAPLGQDGKPDKKKKGEEFERWKNAICAMGYRYHEKITNAADYGIPTRRVRYFAFFIRVELDIEIPWPKPTHNKTGANGLKKWVACKSYIDLAKEGESIFGREFNPNIKKGHRKPLVDNTLKRIAGGIKKFAPEVNFIFQYYGSGLNANDLNSPLNTVTTKDRHVLVSVDKKQFIADHCHTDNYNLPEDPLTPVLTRETKQLITLEKMQFLQKYYSGNNHFSFSPDGPLHSITTKDRHCIITTRAQFIASQYNSRGNPEHNTSDLESPLHAISTQPKHQLISPEFTECGNQSSDHPRKSEITKEKMQFISAYFSSSGNQGSQNSSVNDPLGAITTSATNKALVTAILNGEIDFDIKMRFLDPDELARISTFPEGYFTDKRLKLSRKKQTKLIGNAVPPDWAKVIIEPVLREIDRAVNNNFKKQAI